MVKRGSLVSRVTAEPPASSWGRRGSEAVEVRAGVASGSLELEELEEDGLGGGWAGRAGTRTAAARRKRGGEAGGGERRHG